MCASMVQIRNCCLLLVKYRSYLYSTLCYSCCTTAIRADVLLILDALGDAKTWFSSKKLKLNNTKTKKNHIKRPMGLSRHAFSELHWTQR